MVPTTVAHQSTAGGTSGETTQVSECLGLVLTHKISAKERGEERGWRWTRSKKQTQLNENATIIPNPKQEEDHIFAFEISKEL